MTLERIDEIFFSRKVAYPALFGSSAGVSISVILALFGFNTSTAFVTCLTIMVAYFSLGVFITNAVHKRAKHNEQ